jgi:hypothetical protein
MGSRWWGGDNLDKIVIILVGTNPLPEEITIWLIVANSPVSSPNTDRVDRRAEGFNILEVQARMMWVLFPQAIDFICLTLCLYRQGCIQLLKLFSTP